MRHDRQTYDSSTTDPFDTRKGFGAKVPPPHPCLQAVGDSNGYCEICRSQGDQRPSPGYHMRGLSFREENVNPPTLRWKSKDDTTRNDEEMTRITEPPEWVLTSPPNTGENNEERERRGDRLNEANPQTTRAREQSGGEAPKERGEVDTSESDPERTSDDPETSLILALEAWNKQTEELELLFSELNKPIGSTPESPVEREQREQPHENNGTQNNATTRREKRNKKRKQRTKKANKASTRIGTLNLRGFGDPNIYSKKNKWMHINQIMRDKAYGILAVQETHMNNERCEEINKTHGNRFKVYGSHNPENPTARGGVAIIIKQDKFADPEPVLIRNIVQGRAILIRMKWHKITDSTGKEKWTYLTVLAVYAPNVTEYDGSDNAKFWEEVNQYFETHPSTPKPNILLGDCNMVENPSLDRLPKRNEPDDAREALDTLKMNLNLADGWRETYPDSKEYTFTQQATGSRSRIDRIYMNEKIREQAREWKNNQSPFSGADHSMISVRISCEKAPETGKGRAAIPLTLTEDKQLIDFAIKEGIEAQKNIDKIRERTDSENAQIELYKWKQKVVEKARQREKTVKPRLERKIGDLTRELHRQLNDPTSNDQEKIRNGTELVTELAKLEQQKHSWTREQLGARNRLEGETICKYWIDSSKEQKPRDAIHALEIREKPKQTHPEQNNQGDPPHENEQPTDPTPEQTEQPAPEETVLVGDTRETRQKFETDPKRMAKLARDYHNEIQSDGIENTHPERDAIIENTLKNISTELNPEQREEVGENMRENLVTVSLILSENGTSAGIDGVPFELYKGVQKRGKEDEKRGVENSFSMVKLLTAAFVDIEKYGVAKETKFSEGWMCPIYKKKEKTKVENYRPITLLNTDYKIFTKALALKLAKVAPHLLHKNQAGFVPGRDITDQTQLIRMLSNYAEVKKENGLIVALDQEKAYDKIAHDYLWKTLRTFKFPETFIDTIRSLYENAETKVMVNGHLSPSFRITRGVRQGDPMSCILFDLAIEPLGAMIRNSSLKGYQIGNKDQERIIVNMFADDTTVFLSKDDSLETVKARTDEWCIASRARFNEGKTEIIPIGERTYREEVIQTRKTRADLPGIPEDKHIAKEGEAIRILGAWFGNNIDNVGIWTPTLEKIDSSLQRWEKSNPTMEGRRHIAQMVVGGMTQYLAKVQGMPTEVKKKLEKRINRFVWSDKGQNPVNNATTQKQIEDGGRKVLDIDARNEAIKIMWVQTYLNMSDRPTWATVADEIFKCFTTKAKTLPKEALVNPLLQSWKPNMSSTSKLPKVLLEILKTAEKYKLSLDGIKIAKEAVDAMPIWYHVKADHKQMHDLACGMISGCLRKNHGVTNTGQARTTAILLDSHAHEPKPSCKCENCEGDRKYLGCKHPHWCAERARQLLDLLPEKWDPRETTDEPEEEIRGEKDWTVVKPELTTAKTLHEAIRIFDTRETAEKSNTAVTSPKIKIHGNDGKRPRVAATDGSCLNNGYENAIAGAGVYFGKRDPKNTALRLPKDLEQSNQTGELVAIKIAIEKTDPGQELWIETDSRYAMDSITRNREKYEDQGFIATHHAEIIKDIVVGIRKRSARTLIKWVKGHKGYEPNEKADELANEGARKPHPDQINDWIEPRLNLGGAKLMKLTQALAYKKVRQLKENETPERKRTQATLELVKAQTEETFGIQPTEKAIWKAIRSKDNAMKTRHFLWMMAHDAYMVGDKWLRDSYTDEYKERARCAHCNGKIESMRHIIAECESPGQNEVWELTKSVWERKSKHPWNKPNIGTAIGAGLATIRNPKTLRPKSGENRLWRIMIAESAHLIWKLRCERVLDRDNKNFTPSEIKARWTTMMDERLKLDRALTNRKRFQNKAISEEIVRNTWRHTLRNEDDLPTDWVRKSGVLVGIETDQMRKKGKRGRRRAPTPDQDAQAQRAGHTGEEDLANV